MTTWENRFDNHWDDIWPKLARSTKFFAWVDEIIAEQGVGIIYGDHNVGKSFLVKDAAAQDTDRWMFSLAPNSTVDDWYAKEFPATASLADRRQRLFNGINHSSAPALFFDDAELIGKGLLDEISYLYDKADSCAVFFVSKESLNLPSRLKFHTQSWLVPDFTIEDYLFLLGEISGLFPEDDRLAKLIAAMSKDDNNYIGSVNGLGLWGGFDPKNKYRFRACKSIGQFAKMVGKVKQEADELAIDRPRLSEFFVSDLRLPEEDAAAG